jgi:hypothetical protein
VGPLSPAEGLGVWFSGDYRFAPMNDFPRVELAAMALAVLVFGIVWACLRREFAIPSGVVACALIYMYSRHTQSPYVAAKALTISSPLVMVAGARALSARGEQFRPGSAPVAARAWSLTRLAVLAGFAVAALYSSYEVLRAGYVRPSGPADDLSSLRPLIGNSPTLFLGTDSFAPYELGGARIGFINTTTTLLSPVPVTVNLARYKAGKAPDFDSVTYHDLDNFRFVITPNSDNAAEAPVNFRLVRISRFYQLWERFGATRPRATLAPSGQQGAVLDCNTAAGRRLHRKRGVASVTATPVTVATPDILAGSSVKVTLSVPPGRWQLSVFTPSYLSPYGLEISAEGVQWSVPADLDGPADSYSFGAIGSRGSPIAITLREDRPSWLSPSSAVARPAGIVAQRLPDVRRLMPLRDSCGRYVYWYSLAR